MLRIAAPRTTGTLMILTVFSFAHCGPQEQDDMSAERMTIEGKADNSRITSQLYQISWCGISKYNINIQKSGTNSYSLQLSINDRLQLDSITEAKRTSFTVNSIKYDGYKIIGNLVEYWLIPKLHWIKEKKDSEWKKSKDGCVLRNTSLLDTIVQTDLVVSTNERPVPAKTCEPCETLGNSLCETAQGCHLQTYRKCITISAGDFNGDAPGCIGNGYTWSTDPHTMYCCFGPDKTKCKDFTRCVGTRTDC